MDRYDSTTGMWTFHGMEGLLVAAAFIAILLWMLSGIKGDARAYRKAGPVGKVWEGFMSLLFYGMVVTLLLSVIGAAIGGFR